MKKRNNTAAMLKEILDYLPITTTNAFKLAKVNRTTWNKWIAGTSNPPAATVDLIRMAALGTPPDEAFAEFRFVRGKLYDPSGYGYTPEEIRALQIYKINANRFLETIRWFDLKPKLLTIEPAKQLENNKEYLGLETAPDVLRLFK